MKGMNLLIIEDDDNLSLVLSNRFTKKGFNVTSFSSPKKSIKWLKENKADIVIMDLGLPEIPGMKLMDYLWEIDNELTIIIITGLNDIKTAVEAIKKGTTDYLLKPFDIEELDKTVNNAVLKIKYKLNKEIEKNKICPDFIFSSNKLKEISNIIRKISSIPFSSILITGESGVGKDIIAKTIHCKSSRKDNPFVKINCASIPAELVESELFGYEKGAFTGADNNKPGLFEIARGGTLFLDEIGELPKKIQPKLLRVIEEKKIRRVGGNQDILLDINLISATNRNLEEMVNSGKFRQDLFYRINVFNILIPALRERPEDINKLSEYFLKKKSKEMKIPLIPFSKEVKNSFNKYHWPGNVRELQNVIERSIILSNGEKKIEIKHLPVEISGIKFNCKKNNLKDIQAEYIKEKLSKNDGNITKTANELGISRNTLKKKIKDFNL